MRAWLILSLLLVGCDDDGGGGAPPADAAPPGDEDARVADATSSVDEDGALPDPDASRTPQPDDGVPPDGSVEPTPDQGTPGLAFDCDVLCPTFERDCFDAFTIRGCDDCAQLAERFGGDDHPETYERSNQVCAAGQETADCKTLYACLSDNDGLNGYATGVTVAVLGSLRGVDIELADDAAVVAVGTKGDGRPSDLEVYLEAAAGFYVLRFDDLALEHERGTRDAAEVPVEIESFDAADELDQGEIVVREFDPAGTFSIEATVGPSSGEGELAITVDGRFTP